MPSIFRSAASVSHSKKPRRLASILAFTALATAGCGGDSGDLSTGPRPGTQPPSGAAAIVGLYRLATVNGNPLTVPWETDGAFANYFTAGRIELKADGRFARSLQGRTVIPRMQDILYDESSSGTYTFQPSAPGEDNGRVTLHQDTGGTDQLELTQVSITDVNTVPGTGGGTQQVIFVYVRD